MAAERFDAFISYARASSATLASDLQTGIERFAKPWNRLRACRVFRDDASMSANSGLWSTIEGALQDARWLILIATPEAAVSEYVNTEIAWWVEHKGAASILLVHHSGELSWDRVSGDFSPATDCVPPALRGAYSEEPRWIPFTWFDARRGDGHEAGTAPGPALGASDPRFTERIADLAATIRGVERDALIGENVREHRRARRLARGAAVALGVLLVASVIGGIVAVAQGNEAAAQRDTAREQLRVATARQLASTAQNRTDTDLESALLLASSAYALEPDAQTYSALFAVASATPELDRFLDAGTGEGSVITSAAGTSDASHVVAGTADGRVLMWTIDAAATEASPESRTAVPAPVVLTTVEGAVEFVEVSDDASVVLAGGVTREGVNRDVVARDTALWAGGDVTPLAVDLAPLAMSPSGGTVLGWLDRDDGSDVFSEPYDVVTLQDGAEVARRPADLPPAWVSIPDDSTVVSMDGRGSGLVETVGGAAVSWSSPMGTWEFGGALSESGTRFTFTNGDTDFSIWDVPGAPENQGQAMLRANAPDARPSGVALSDSGLLATARDGVIYLGDIVSKDAAVPPARELRGAGNTPRYLSFLDDSTLLSASGTSLALWSLDEGSRLTTTLPAEIPFGCSACGPPHVAVDPSGARAVVVSDFDAAVTFVDADSGTSIGDLRDTVSFGGASDAVWLDEDRVLLVDAASNDYTVLSGADLATVDSSGTLDAAISPGTVSSAAERLALRDDGSVVYVSGDTTSIVDPASGTVRESFPAGGVLTGDGRYVVSFPSDPSASTVVVYDAGTGAELAQAAIPVRVIPAATAVDDTIILWSDTGDGDARVLQLDLPTGEVTDRGVTSAPASVSAISAEGIAATVENGWVSLIPIDPLVEVQALTLPPGVRQWTSIGFSTGAGHLVAANEPGSTITFLPIDPAVWSRVACAAAGSHLSVDQWAAVTGERELYVDACPSNPPRRSS
jgi:hypothetical protein